MKEMRSWLITFFIIMFWGFRVMVAMNTGEESDFAVQAIDLTTEIILLFVVLALVPFIFKRQIWAALVYLGLYGWYFGRGLFTNVMAMINEETLTPQTYLEMLVAFVGIVIPIAAVFDILMGKVGKSKTEKNTDWYYENKDYDRVLDERADRNNYRTL